MKKKAIIAMSGGVDSSVAAFLMKNEGFDCTGVTLKLHNNVYDSEEKTCCSLKDTEDAQTVASALGMPFYVFNFTEYFEDAVIKRFVDTYIEGGTPNPCIDCNRYIKFEKLLDRMYELEHDYVVTGHYARIEQDENTGRYLLKKGLDESKDQSYVLYNLTQEQLSHTLFPLGGFHKSEIRELAEREGFVNAKKQDSQDICFVPDGDYASFIERYTGETFPKGEFRDMAGNVLGTHKGMIRYTIGQRKGLGLALPEPLYVCKKNMQENAVILGKNEVLFTTTFEAEDMNWISISELAEPITCMAKTRYKQREARATVEPMANGRVQVIFDEPQRGITRGQAVVMYDGDIVIGGGRIL